MSAAHAAPLRSAPVPAPVAAPTPVPDAVRGVLRSPGRPLDPDVRAWVEPRFGHRFDRVRVHADGAGAAASAAVGAAAFAFGEHVAFGAGRYAPGSAAGRRLLVHELAHVAQQARGAPAPDETPAEARDEAEAERVADGVAAGRPVRVGPGRPRALRRQAAATADRAPAASPAQREAFGRDALDFLRGQRRWLESVPNLDEARLATILDGMKRTVEGLLPTAAPAFRVELETAYREGVESALGARVRATARSARPETLAGLREAHRAAILPAGLATADPGADELTAELDAPAAPGESREARARRQALTTARQRMRVVTAATQIDVPGLFSTRTARVTIGLPANTTVRPAANVPARLQPGLRNVAATLAQGPLEANTTIQVALDLSAFAGGHAAYRFTRVDVGTAAGGTGGGGTAAGEIWVERLGDVGAEGLPSPERTAAQERFTRLGFVRGTGFRGDEFDQVLLGLADVPDAALTPLAGLTFARTASDAEHPDAAGHYDQATHTVRLFDRAFAASQTRFGAPGHARRFAAEAVVHEVGHALDLRPLRTTAAATSAANRALLGAFGTGDGGYTIPDRRDPTRARYDALRRATTTAETAERSARSLSGARWDTAQDPSPVVDAPAPGAATSAFRRAAEQDGAGTARFPTTYPTPESFWQEYFAEAFALYQSDPAGLRRLRPNVFRYFEGQFPRTP